MNFDMKKNEAKKSHQRHDKNGINISSATSFYDISNIVSAKDNPIPFPYENIVLAKALKDRNFDIIDEILDVYYNGALDPKERFSILNNLLPYLLPKLTASNIKNTTEGQQVIEVIYKNNDIKMLD